MDIAACNATTLCVDFCSTCKLRLSVISHIPYAKYSLLTSVLDPFAGAMLAEPRGKSGLTLQLAMQPRCAWSSATVASYACSAVTTA